MSDAPNVYAVGQTVVLKAVFTIHQTKGTIIAGQSNIAVQDATGYSVSSPVFIPGAGTEQGDLTTTVTAVVGNILTLATPAGTTVYRSFVGLLADPDTVVCRVRKPDLTTTTPSVTQASTGKYTAQYTVAAKGDHFWEFVGTGAAKGEDERQFVGAEDRVVA